MLIQLNKRVFSTETTLQQGMAKHITSLIGLTGADKGDGLRPAFLRFKSI